MRKGVGIPAVLKFKEKLIQSWKSYAKTMPDWSKCQFEIPAKEFIPVDDRWWSAIIIGWLTSLIEPPINKRERQPRGLRLA